MKFKWETQIEYEYREGINKIAGEVGKILLATKKMPDYKLTFDEISKKISQLKRMVTPICYDEIKKLLIEGYSYYLKGYRLLFDLDKINDELTTKAALFINCANSYVKIVTCKNLELLEMRQLNYTEVEADNEPR